MSQSTTLALLARARARSSVLVRVEIRILSREGVRSGRREEGKEGGAEVVECAEYCGRCELASIAACTESVGTRICTS